MNRLLLIILLLVTILITKRGKSQDNPVRFQHITTKDGLSQSVVYSILQDKSGYMWFGLYNGLSRYDGYNFTNFQHNPRDSTSIPFGSVQALCEDSKGRLWVATTIGKFGYFDALKEKFVNYDLGQNANAENIDLPLITTIIEDKKGNIWLGTQNDGIARWEKNSQKLKFYKKGTNSRANGLADNSVFCSYLDKNGKLWFGLNHGGLCHYDEKSDEFTCADFKDPRPNVNVSLSVYKILPDDDDKIFWLGTNDGLIKYDPAQGKFEQFLTVPENQKPQNLTYVTTLCKDNNGYLWLGTYNKGIKKWDKRNGLVASYKYEEEEIHGLKSNKITSIYQDRSGNIWAGSEEGIYKVDIKKPKFYLYRPSFYTFNSYHKKGIRDIIQDKKGNIWLGTEGNGLVKIYDDKLPKATRYLYENYSEEAYGINYINSLFEDNGNNIWLGGVNGVHVFNLGSNNFLNRNDPLISDLKKDSLIYAVIRDHNGILWLGTRKKGLISFDPKKRQYSRYLYSKNDTASISSNMIWCFYEDKNMDLWIGTSLGLNKLIRDKKNNKYTFKRFTTEISKNLLPGANIWDICEDRNGNLWMATADGGLKKLDKKTGKFKVFTSSDGLPSNVICAILEDDHGMFWISSLNGIFRFNPFTAKVIHTFNENDGLQNNRFNLRARYKNKETGEMFFAGPEGFNRFHPDSIILNSYKAPLVINSFKVLYVESKDKLLKDSAISLDYNQNSFSFEFASLDFTHPNENKFAYKLAGQDKNWIYPGNRHFVSYTNLEPGTYTFLLKGTNSDGMWSDEQLRFNITIIPPIWKRWWFILIFILFLLLILLIIVRAFLKSKDTKRKILQAELNNLRTQLNSHFIFNSLSSLQHFIMKNEKTLALNYLSKFATLMRMILANSGQALIPLSVEKKFLELYLFMESVRFDNKFTFQVDVDPAINMDSIKIPPMLLQPLVENALKHGLVTQTENGGRILISCKCHGNDLQCIVEDNGIGRKKAEEFRKSSNITHNSKGINLVNERLKLFNSGRTWKANIEITDLYNAAGEPAGTRAEIYFPLIIE